MALRFTFPKKTLPKRPANRGYTDEPLIAPPRQTRNYATNPPPLYGDGGANLDLLKSPPWRNGRPANSPIYALPNGTGYRPPFSITGGSLIPNPVLLYSDQGGNMPLMPTFQGNTAGSGAASYGGGGYSNQSETAEEPIEWTETYNLPNAPSWWRGLTPSRLTAETEYISMLNAMIPFLSPEEQDYYAANISRYSEGIQDLPFQSYDPTLRNYNPNPPDMNSGVRDQYMSSSRGWNMVEALEAMASSMGKDTGDFGAGYQFLQQIATALETYGGTGSGVNEHMSRANVLRFLGAVDPLLNETSGEALGAYGALANSIVRPFFSSGAILPVSRDQNGNYTFGGYNNRWF